MEELIRQAFLHVDVIGPHVADGRYDLVGPTGDIILPQVWETVVEPDWTITMHMWPIPEPPPEPEPVTPGDLAAVVEVPPEAPKPGLLPLPCSTKPKVSMDYHFQVPCSRLFLISPFFSPFLSLACHGTELTDMTDLFKR